MIYRVILSNIKFSYKNNIAWLPKINVVLEHIIFPLISSLFYILVAYTLNGGKNLEFFIIGSLCSIAIDSCIGGPAVLISADKRFRTLPNLITASCNGMYVFIGRTLYWCILGGVKFLIIYVGVFGIFGIGLLNPIKLLIFIIVFLAMSFSISGIGYILGIIGLFKRSIFGISSLVTLFIIVFSGVYFEIEKLWFPLRFISYILPSTYGIKISRLIYNNGFTFENCNLIVLMILTASIYWILGYLLYKNFERSLVKNQNWELF